MTRSKTCRQPSAVQPLTVFKTKYMPILANTSYPGPPFYEWNGHMQTILPALLRLPKQTSYERERLELNDGDFVDLDWLEAKSRSLVILSHGLEGNSQRYYMQSMAKFFHRAGWDVLAWNCRSCSGEMNRKLRLYYHGEIDDFSQVIKHALHKKDYEQIVLIGFSMGGSILMKYLGVYGKEAPPSILCGIAFSSPCDLEGGVIELEKPQNAFFKKRFFNSISAKIRIKAELFPDKVSTKYLDQVQYWKDFDRFYSAPINGFSSPEAFYYDASAKNFMSGTKTPVLLVNAANDPILSPNCYPFELCKKHNYINLEVPPNGGHVGFNWRRFPYTWMEHRAMDFLSEVKKLGSQ